MSDFKVVFLGGQWVGKTSLINSFMCNSFERAYQGTIVCDFLTIKTHINNRKVILQLWDTAGQERFRAVSHMYIRGSNVAIIVYDITSSESFKMADRWIEDVRKQGDDVIFVLVGNKTDLENEREVSVEEGEKKAREMDLMFVETSAKSGYNVKHLLRIIIQSLSKIIDRSMEKKEGIVPLSDEPKTPSNKSNDCSC